MLRLYSQIVKVHLLDHKSDRYKTWDSRELSVKLQVKLVGGQLPVGVHNLENGARRQG